MHNQSDNLDFASALTQERTDATIAAQVAEYREACKRIGRDDCIECGEDIPVARQIAVNGVQHCRPCAERIDLKARGVRRV